MSRYDQKRYRANRAEGRCARCCQVKPLRPKQDGTPGVRCEECYQAVLAVNRLWKGKKRARLRKAGGWCLLCFKAHAIPGIKICGRCAEIQSDRNMRIREDRKALGLCPLCAEPHAEGRVLCSACLQAQRERKRQEPGRAAA